MRYDVRFEDRAAQTVISSRRSLLQADLHPFVTQAVAEMRGILRDAGVPEAGSPFTIYHEKVTPERVGEIEVCVPCAPSRLDAEVVERREIPAARVALVHVPAERARYPDVLEAYDAAADGILAGGWLLGDAPRETYLDDGDVLVAWPLGTRATTAHAVIANRAPE